MSSASADVVPSDDANPQPKRGKKKLIILLAAALLLFLLGGGATIYFVKKRAAEAEALEAEEGEHAGESAAAAQPERRKHEKGHVPTFVTLDPFVVNLADKEVDRFAQIGVILEVDDPKFADELRAYMPAIRNGILMVLAHKTSQQLLAREGKLALAKEIMREAVLPLGIDPAAEEKAAAQTEEESEDEDEDAPKKKKKKKKAAVQNPVTHVHFSNFIIQ